MLVKSIPDVNFINILWVAFTRPDAESSKKDSQVVESFWCFLESARLKAARRMLMKLTPVVNFINVKFTNFSYERCFGSFFYVQVTRKKLPKWRSYKKFAHLTLMKLTPGVVVGWQKSDN